MPRGTCISVFILFDRASRRGARAVAVQEASQLETHRRRGAARVVLHERSRRPCVRTEGVPEPITMATLTLSPPEDEGRDPSMEDRGTIFSKVGGIPGWAQDPIEVADHDWVLQLSEQDIIRRSPSHHGILGGDTGFLFLDRELALGDAGLFFVQFT